jgi:hypothetical protein
LEKIARKGWSQDSEYWTSKKKKEIQHAMNTKAARFDPSTAPLLAVITSMTTTASANNKMIRSDIVIATIPRQLSRGG